MRVDDDELDFVFVVVRENVFVPVNCSVSVGDVETVFVFEVEEDDDFVPPVFVLESEEEND